MTIAVGDTIPAVTTFQMQPEGPSPVTTDTLFAGQRVVMFGVPGAFTPTCSTTHLPGFVMLSQPILDTGIDRIICLSVNDPFVMHAWGKEHHAIHITLLGDGNADLTRALGLDMDGSARGMGTRCRRFAMIVNDGRVEHLAVEAPGQFEVSSAEKILELLKP